MEWTKIKPKHFLFTDFTLQHHGALVRILCLTAHLERVPSEREMIQCTHHAALKSLRCKLDEHSMSLQCIIDKVLEDSEWIEHKRSVSRSTSERYRNKDKKRDTSRDTTEKRREEKIRIEKKYISILDCEFVKITQEEHDKLTKRMGKHTLKAMIEELHMGIGTKGYKYKSHYLAILKWWKRAGGLVSKKDQAEQQEKEFNEKYGDPTKVNPEGQAKVADIMKEAMGGNENE